ncbi:MAG: Coenzyme F420 hydrogenase/dehydrogenase, beta subunit C-terminal domain [Endomicrobiaceae bacterium]|nr:Coenzyme F420 hydrogenase/dehydrogenase, beta subunit C-terminal domain [Endomicrobiaceae bacterium]MDD3922216.1 Coenzyme F420 hydrogenase/dehydrogenase, beta subunit C-terminal domain [Endomicrobiaceae bacterium]
MINLKDKKDCCGCSACYNICQQKAIFMQEDIEGFLYPIVDNKKCVKCNLCIKVCPILNNKKETNLSELYGCKNKNVEEQKISSSGGIFSLLANYILDSNGIVFGASYNDKWEVIHKFIDKKDDLDSLRRSKYVQSDIKNTYKKSKEFLDNNKFVLFCGTPCQIAGLKNFLNKDYTNLYTMDFICFGVPSPKIWSIFLKQNFETSKITSINFRYKEFGWDHCYLKIHTVTRNYFVTLYKKFKHKCKKYLINLLSAQYFFSRYYYLSFFKGFLYSLFLRPSCHTCVFKGTERYSDITVYDLWGVNNIAPQLYDSNGVSGLNINSEKGKFLFEKIKSNLFFTIINYEQVIKSNPRFLTSNEPHNKREEFFERYKKENLNKLINSLLGERFLILKIVKATIKKFKKFKYHK